MRQVILDTETTGLEPERGHRIIEIGCVELLNRRLTGRSFHKYLDPERDIDEGAQAVHGISRAQLNGAPKFADVASELLAFIQGAELVIHNAAFDVGFVNAELVRWSAVGTADAAQLPVPRAVADLCSVLDTLALARSLHPGQRNSLDALCKRYAVDNSRRELHGALLDAQLLAEVYLAMTGGQAALALSSASSDADRGASVRAGDAPRQRPAECTTGALRVIAASVEELEAHAQMLERITKAAGRPSLWQQSAPDGAQ